METKRKYDIKNISVILFFITTFFVTGCGENPGQGGKNTGFGEVYGLIAVPEF